ncbi:hypothetical protein RJ640_022294 [Escallonia rubra]|uniref:Retropepsins domain-containing protein n=1 Tax=Escallonia rubra TaxID=112253 RepID=A0AA88UAC1_9ASTE|nr:hypothetical protein RJ640_022294 [Escallonia rubra]
MVEHKDPNIQDPQSEIIILKREIKTLADRISLLESRNHEEVFSEGEEYLKPNPNYVHNPETSPPNHFDDPNQEIRNLDKVTFQKCYVGIKIVIDQDFIFEGISLVDSGVDLNCIREGIVPTKYCEATKQALTTADSSRMKINYKISDCWVCNNGICLEAHFIVVRGLSQSIILGTPFMSLLNPMIINDDGIHSKIMGQDICFRFINPPQEQNLSKEKIIPKIFAGKMTPQKSSLQVSGKGLRPRGNIRYYSRQMEKTIDSISSSSYNEDMFETSAYNAHSNLWDIIIIEDEEANLPPIEVANHYLNKNWAILQQASGKSR